MKLKKADWILLIVILAVAGIFLLIRAVTGANPGGSIEVRIDGKLVGTYSLAEDMKKTFEYEDGSYNTIMIADGKVSVIEADCPDKYCVNKGAVNRENDTIICLPHKFVVKVIKSNNKGPDIVAE